MGNCLEEYNSIDTAFKKFVEENQFHIHEYIHSDSSNIKELLKEKWRNIITSRYPALEGRSFIKSDFGDKLMIINTLRWSGVSMIKSKLVYFPKKFEVGKEIFHYDI